MQRELHPEILDTLPPDHPDAIHNRRDLRLTNRMMGNGRWWEQTLPPVLRPGERVLELGAGTGELALRLAGLGVVVDGLDRWPRPAGWPAAHEWWQTDLRRFDGYDRYQALIGNLIFHQFSAAELADFGRRLPDSVRVILACEPQRRRLAQWAFAGLAPLIRANYVSRHDAHVSIAAGFRDSELPEFLGLDPARWSWHCHTTTRGAFRMVALRRP